MTREEKISYLQAGTDCVISESTSKEDLVSYWVSPRNAREWKKRVSLK